MSGEVKQKILVILGPTGVGKSALSLELAKRLDGEIVMADSQSVLRGFDIGTAKPNPEERSVVPHHLLDVADFGELFDANRFASLADAAIADIVERGRKPLVAGGTGLYLKALLHGFMQAPSRDEAFRRGLEKRIAEEGLPSLYAELVTLDPERAAEIHSHDAIRIIRALEICRTTGRKPSQLAREHRFQGCKYDALKIGLKLPREELYRRIDQRVLAMLNQGWVEEVRGLLAKGHDLLGGRTQTIGYPTLARLLNGEIFVNDAIAEIQRETRQLAKRQLAWFRSDKEIRWFEPSEFDAIFEASLAHFSKASFPS